MDEVATLGRMHSWVFTILTASACVYASGGPSEIRRPPKEALSRLTLPCKENQDCSRFQVCMPSASAVTEFGAVGTCEIPCNRNKSVSECPDSSVCIVGQDLPSVCYVEVGVGMGSAVVVGQASLSGRHAAAVVAAQANFVRQIGRDEWLVPPSELRIEVLDRRAVIEVLFFAESASEKGSQPRLLGYALVEVAALKVMDSAIVLPLYRR